MKVERRLVIAACLPDAADAARAVAEVLRKDNPDWDEVYRLAVLNAVAPLVHRTLRQPGVAVIPALTLDRLQRFVRENSFRSLAFTVELSRVLPALRAAGVPAVAFKGLVLAQAAYQDVSVRQVEDLDFLIHFGQLPAARAALAGLGYEPTFRLSPNQQRAIVRHMGEMHFTRSTASVDVHWRLVGPSFPLGYDLTAIEHRLSKVTIGELVADAPSVEDHLLILAINANKDLWQRLDRIAAIARLAAVYELDWAYVLATARRWGILRMVLLALELARVQFQSAPSPEVASAVAADPAVARLAAGISARRDDASFFRPTGLQRGFLATWERRRDRGAYLARLLLLPAEAEAAMVDLPRWLAFLYYPLRLGRVLSIAARARVF